MITCVEEFTSCYPNVFVPRRMMNLLMNAMQSYIEIDVEKYSEVIKRIWIIAKNYFVSNFSVKTMDVILSYANIYYIRRLQNYPIILVSALALILNVYILSKEKVMKELKAAVTAKRRCNLISVVLTILRYFIYQIEFHRIPQTKDSIKSFSKAFLMYKFIHDEFRENDVIFLKYHRKRFDVIDKIIGICLYLAVDFNWNTFKDLAKDIIKEEARLAKSLGFSSTMNMHRESLIITLIKLAEKIKEIKVILLKTVFFNCKEAKFLLSITSYKALISIAFNNPKEILNFVNLGVSLNNLVKDSKVIDSSHVLEFVIRHAEMFTPHVKELLINDVIVLLVKNPKLMKDLAQILVKPILNLSQLPENPNLIEVQAELLCNSIFLSQPHCCCYLSDVLCHKLCVLNRALDMLLDSSTVRNEKHTVTIILKCVDFTYVLEDIIEMGFMKTNPSELFMKVLCKLMLLLDKTDLLYITLPSWTVFEQREVMAKKEIDKVTHQEREGGILRILLKLTLICVKKNKNDISYNLLKYLIFRDTLTKKKLKDYVERKSSVKPIDKKKMFEKLKNRQCLLNMILNKNAEAVKYNKTVNEYYLKKVIAKNYSVMSDMMISKLDLSNEINYFEYPQTLSLHILAALIQLIYFELLEVESYSQVPEENSYVEKLAEFYRLDERELSSSCKQIIEILRDIIKEDETNIILSMLSTDLIKLTDICKDKLTSGLIDLRLGNIYSSLDPQINIVKGKQLDEEELEIKLIHSAGICIKFITSLINVLRFDIDTKELYKDIIDILLTPESLFKSQPIILFFTLHSFYKLDSWLASPLTSPKEDNDISEDLQNRIQEVFTEIKVPKDRLKKDVIDSHFTLLGKSLYRRIVREQKSVLGPWFNKASNKYHKRLFHYVKKKHEKICGTGSPFNEFVILSKKRDKKSRCLIFKRYNKIEKDPSLICNYGYIKKYILKKILIKAVSSIKISTHEFYGADLEFKLMKNLFNINFNESSYMFTPIQDYDKVEPDECISNTRKPYEVEMITIENTIFGKLALYKDCIMFYTVNKKNKGIVKELSNRIEKLKIWKMTEINEIVVKSYDILKQIVEIYLINDKSILFSFLEENKLINFIEKFDNILTKRKDLSIELILYPDSYFVEKQFTNQWITGTLSNFDYIMLLNKYSRRTFNNLNQYPVFPLVTGAYVKSEELSVKQLKNSKQQKGEKENSAKILSSETVLMYLMKCYPYTSLLDEYKEKMLKSNKYLLTITKFISKFKEIQGTIPEYFYLPELFNNLNLTLFDVRESIGQKRNTKIKENTTIWNHKLIRRNIIALESVEVSLELNRWIDTVFSEEYIRKSLSSLMTDTSNMEVATRHKTISSKHSSKELHDSVIYTMEFLNGKHPPRDKKKITEKAQCVIFSSKRKSKAIKGLTADNSEETKIVLYAFSSIKSIESCHATIFIASFERKVLAILSSQKLYQTKDAYINAACEKTICFEKKEYNLFPFKPFYNHKKNLHNFYDSQRCFGARFNGTQLITCRHYDCSWRIVDGLNGSIKEIVYVTRTMINCICVVESTGSLFTGSSDGVLTLWDKGGQVMWSEANHNSGIVSMDVCEKLTLVVTASTDKDIVIRNIYNGKLIRVITLEITKPNVSYAISHVRLSHCGYVIVIEKRKDETSHEDDYIYTFSVNGEGISKKKVGVSINVIVVSESGYEFIVGGNNGKLLKYKLLTLKEYNLLDYLDIVYKGTNVTLVEFTNSSPSITAMSLTMQENCQNLILGTNIGIFYVFKYSPRLLQRKGSAN